MSTRLRYEIVKLLSTSCITVTLTSTIVKELLLQSNIKFIDGKMFKRNINIDVYYNTIPHLRLLQEL